MTHLFHGNVAKAGTRSRVRRERKIPAPAFGARLAGTARSVLAGARAALQDPKLSDAQAVHELRKAFKRWRTLLRLLEDPVGAGAARMRREARELMRLLTGARDAQSVLDALADLEKGDTALSPAALDTMRTRLTALRNAAERTAFTTEIRARIARHLDKAETALTKWSLEAVAFSHVADPLTATYRRARRLVPKHWRKADPETLHSLRQRVVEFRHQIELIEPLRPRRGKSWGAGAQRLRNQLGACQDLALLTRFTEPTQPLARWRARLIPVIEARHATHSKNAARLARRLFGEKPKVFRKRIAALDNRQRPALTGAQTRKPLRRAASP
jgi:CHAD domain-containing protein